MLFFKLRSGNLVGRMPGTCGFCLRASDLSKILARQNMQQSCVCFRETGLSCFGALPDGRNAQNFYGMIRSRTL